MGKTNYLLFQCILCHHVLENVHVTYILCVSIDDVMFSEYNVLLIYSIEVMIDGSSILCKVVSLQVNLILYRVINTLISHICQYLQI